MRLKRILLAFSILTIFINSCSPIITKNRNPSSALKYAEFNFEREFIFNEENCVNNQAPYLTREDYTFEEFLAETTIDYYASNKVLKERFELLYSSDRRLKKRLFYRQDKFILPHSRDEIIIEKNFLNSLAYQIELAFRMNIVDFLFYPDMGHGHLYLPQDEDSSSMQNILANPRLKIIYHTAEQLMMKNGQDKRDPLEYRQFRYRTRNIIGGFDDRGSLELIYAHNNKIFNTLHEVPGRNDYLKQGGTLYFSANKNGCIGYKVNGLVHYFDLSFNH